MANMDYNKKAQYFSDLFAAQNLLSAGFLAAMSAISHFERGRKNGHKLKIIITRIPLFNSIAENLTIRISVN